MRTFSGLNIDPANPRPEMFTVESIAHSLSFIVRFTGHLKYQYSVAQHSVLVALMVRKEIRMEALFHDGEEIVVNDLGTELKHLPDMQPYVKHGDKVQACIAAAFNLRTDEETHKEIKRADLMLCELEKTLFPGERPALRVWDAEEAEAAFLEMYRDCLKTHVPFIHI